MKIQSGLLIALCGMLISCANTEKLEWAAVGGSKADGTVVLGIEVPAIVGVRETTVEWDPAQANSEADRRCKNWGYAGAEAFRGKLPVQKTCFAQGVSPCWSKSYRINYQCLDKN